ncbi:MAG: response regulator receiver [Stygiobacter sp.]|nr:MAG: response regulator receiver [Stygiobacter sp.]KAF0215194.1 MAG: response regulator [Ignavibacteria bacterium]
MEFHNYTILIVEDDEIILDIFSRIFKREFNVVSCPTVESFYQALRKFKVDLFVMDMALGDKKNGLDLIKELRDSVEYKTTPIVVVSAHAYIRDERIALTAGADKYIRKPIENKYLVNEVKRILLDKIHLN